MIFKDVIKKLNRQALLERSLRAWTSDKQTRITTGYFYKKYKGKMIGDGDPEFGRIPPEIPVQRRMNKRLPIGGISPLRYACKFDIRLGHLTVPVKTAKEEGAWMDMERKGNTYKPMEVIKGSGGKMVSFKGNYIVEILWDDWMRTLSDYVIRSAKKRAVYPKETKMELIDRMLNDLDIKLHCNCPSFFWQSMQYRLTGLNSAIYPENSPPPSKGQRSTDWQKKHTLTGDSQYPVCKHIKSVLFDMDKGIAKYFYDKIYREFEKVLGPD